MYFQNKLHGCVLSAIYIDCTRRIYSAFWELKYGERDEISDTHSVHLRIPEGSDLEVSKSEGKMTIAVWV